MKKILETVTIETPEHLELQFELAGIGTRLLAFCIDRLIQWGFILALFLTLTLILGLLGVISDKNITPLVRKLSDIRGPLIQWTIAAVVLVYGVITIGYFILFEYLWSGSTPGKRAMNIRVMRKDGRPLSFPDAAVRNILRFVDFLADLYPLGAVVMFIDSQNRRLGDLAAGTLVVQEKTMAQPSVDDSDDDSLFADPAIRRAAANLNGEDYQLITRFLSRRNSLDLQHRESLCAAICDRVFKGSDYPVDESSRREAVLEALTALYRERARIF